MVARGDPSILCAGEEPLYDPEEEEEAREEAGSDEPTMTELFRAELLALAGFIMKVHMCTPSRPHPLPFVLKLFKVRPTQPCVHACDPSNGK